MNSNQNEHARTTEDNRRNKNTAANTINAFFNNKTKMQSKLNDNCIDENEYN